MDKEKKHVHPCPFCGPESPLSLGIGRTHAHDIFFGYGIPVCFACGGLGIIVDDDEFKIRAMEINQLRKAYCPGGDIPSPEVPSVRILEQLAQKVSALFDQYGGKAGSFAAKIKAGGLDSVIGRHRLAREQAVARLYEQPLTGDPCAELLLKANVAMLREEKDAELLYIEAVMEYPENSDTFLAYGYFLLTEKRDREAALAQYYKAIEIDPDRALCYVLTSEALEGANRINESRRLLARCTSCSDFGELNTASQAAALRRKEEYAELLAFS